MNRTVLLERKLHDRKGFDCGVEPLDSYLKNLAAQQSDRDISRTYVLASKEEKGVIIGYYTLSMIAIELQDVPKEIKKSFPRYNVAGLLARLAVDRRFQGKGWGAWLLADALKRLLHASEEVGFPMVVVDAKEGMESFYLHYGFRNFAKQRGRLFMPVADIRKSMD